MALIEGLRVKNYRALKDVLLGRTINDRDASPLDPLTVVIGRNGTGKSSLFDAFGFLADCLTFGVEDACYRGERGGYERLRSYGQDGPIEFEIYYRESKNDRPISYTLVIDSDKHGRPFVAAERLRQRRKGESRGWPYSFLDLKNGKGSVWAGDSLGKADEESSEKEYIELDDPRFLGIATLGHLKEHPRISLFRRFIEGWYLSYFTPNSARDLPRVGPQKHLNRDGSNLGNVVQFMEKEHPRRFDRVLEEIADKIPGVLRIETEVSNDGRLLIQFHAEGFDKPFYAQNVSDGTLKMFAYLLLLEDPDPAPFLCIEEPENGLYHKLLQTLVFEFREAASGRKGGVQLFVTTHQPYLVDELNPSEVWILEKESDGFSKLTRASEIPEIVAMVDQGLTLGSLWYSDHIDARI
ncbi:AAA family ATPase [Vibrio fluvialis]|uniref:AAA family ATPase n=2 Tax=Vibrio fluvialis TaxID=676 RepID=UPI001C9D5C6E|nr:AAA family ATPase [Vibrio fluvialis]MBY8035495.1 AAA family ATPase [Vibrio fluvialis]MBY8194496.1 AAA family ATPase [Vibrio fluvialis]MCE7652775.1 AAA family ATPase [Vibrio fluvialis]MDE5175612.1 AAA family ATPase [Vibrio fluvialis]